MNSPLARLRKGATVLAIIVLSAVCAFRWTGQYTWVEAIWMVVVTISTVGYGESSDQTTSVQLTTIFVIVFGVTAGAYTFAGFVQVLLAGEIEEALGIKKMTREINKLSDHVVVCGFGRLGQDLADQLSHRKIPYVVIDIDEAKIEKAKAQGQLVLEGDATLESVLDQAGLKQARAIVSALPTDAENVFIALTARNLVPKIQIVAKSEEESSCRKLRQAGANKIVMPHRVGAQQMERMISRPTTADLIELFAEATDMEMELDELTVPSGSQLVGKTIKQSQIKEKYGVLLVGIKDSSGEFQFNPGAEHEIKEDELLLVMGEVSGIQKMKSWL